MRVVEISNLEGAAGFAGKLFRRWGAEVIRVESRDRRPPEIHRDLYVNGGKNRLQIDFNDEEDMFDEISTTLVYDDIEKALL